MDNESTIRPVWRHQQRPEERDVPSNVAFSPDAPPAPSIDVSPQAVPKTMEAAGQSSPCPGGSQCPVAADPEANAVAVWEWDLRTGEVFLDHEPSATVCWQGCEVGTVMFPWLALVHPRDRDGVQCALNAHLTGTTPTFKARFRTLGPDRNRRLVLSRGHCRRDAAGRPVRVIGTHVDLGPLPADSASNAGCIEWHGGRVGPGSDPGTEIPAAHLCSVTRWSSDCHWKQDKHLRFVEVSGDTLRLWGVRPDALLGRTLAELPGSVEDDRTRLEHAQRAREAFVDLVIGVPGDNGAVRWISVSGEPTLDINGSFGGYLGVGRDVSEAEQLRLALAATMEHVRITAQYGRVGSWAWEIATDRFRFSAGIADWLGIADEGTGIPAAAVFGRIHPLDRQRLDAAPGGVTGTLMRDGFECRVTSPAGETRWLSLRGLRTMPHDRTGAVRAGVIQDVTQRKKAEIALRTSEERFRVLLEVSSDYYWEQDEQFRFTEIRKGGFANVPSRGAGSLGKRPWDDDEIEPPSEGWEQRRAFLDQHRAFRDVVRRRRLANGEERTLLLSGFPAFDVDGRFVGYRGVSQDITDRERDHRRALESAARFRALTELSADWYWEQDAEMRYTMISDGYYRLMKFTPGARLGLRRWEVDADLVAADVWDSHMRCLDAHEPFIDLVIARRDGEGMLRTHCVSGMPVFDEAGRFLGYRGVTRDVTDAKRAEDALRQSEHRFRMLAERTRDVVWISDPAITRIDYVNPSVATVWGIPQEALIRQPSLWRTVVHPEDRSIVEEALGRQLNGEGVDTEFRIRRPDGVIRWLWVRSTPTQSEHGDRIVCGIAEDITSRKLAQLRDLDEAVRQRDALVREVHHRIKNNLQGVAGLLRSHAHRDQHAATALELAIAQIQAIATVHGLQGTEGGGGVEIARVVEAIAHMLEALTSVRIRIELGDRSGPRFQLAEEEAVVTALILNEIIVNAVKHSDPGADDRGVRVFLRATSAYAEIVVRNPGSLPPGFHLPQRAGLGTGLKLVSALMPKHGLSLSIQPDEAGVTATVRVATPVVRPLVSGTEDCAV